MAKRSKEEAMETRERILDAAVEVFHARGVARPSLSDVAALAGVTRGAVYGHFTNKGDLFNALCERVSLPTEAVCEADPHAYENDPLGLLRATWIYMLERTVSDWRRILEIIFHRCEIVEDNGSIQQRMLAGYSEASNHFAGLMAKAVQKKQLPADLDLELATFIAHGTMIGLISNWLLAPDAYDLPAEYTRCVDAALDLLRLSPAVRKKKSTGRAPAKNPQAHRADPIS